MVDTDETIGFVGGAIGGLLVLIIILLLIILCFLVHLLRKSNRSKRADSQQHTEGSDHGNKENNTGANPTPPWDNPMYGGDMGNAADAMYDTVMDSAQQPMSQSKAVETKGDLEMTQSYDYVDDEAFERKPNVPEITCTAPQPDNSGTQPLSYEPVASESASPSEKKPREYLYSVPMKKRSLSTSAGRESKDQYSRLQHAGPKGIGSRQTRYSVPTFTEDGNGGTAGRSYYNVVITSSTPEANPQPVEGESCYSDDNPPPLPPPITDPEFQSPQPGNGATIEESYVYDAALFSSPFPQDQRDRGFLMGMEEALYDYAGSIQRQGVTTQPPYEDIVITTFQNPQELYDEIK